MEFFGVCEISLRPSEISDGKKEKNLYWWAKTGVRKWNVFQNKSLGARFSQHFVYKWKEEERRKRLKCLKMSELSKFLKEMLTFVLDYIYEHWSSWFKKSKLGGWSLWIFTTMESRKSFQGFTLTWFVSMLCIKSEK